MEVFKRRSDALQGVMNELVLRLKEQGEHLTLYPGVEGCKSAISTKYVPIQSPDVGILAPHCAALKALRSQLASFRRASGPFEVMLLCVICQGLNRLRVTSPCNL